LPPGEEALFNKAKQLMASDSPVDWKLAYDKYIVPLQERFPDSQHSDEIEGFLLKYNMDLAEKRANNNERLGRPADSEAERLYTEAWKYEKAGDRLTAWEKYRHLIPLYATSQDESDQAYVGLARLAIERLKTDPGRGKSQVDLVKDRVEAARGLIDRNELFEARKILDSVVSLYGENRELMPLVDQARNLLDQISGKPGNNTPAER